MTTTATATPDGDLDQAERAATDSAILAIRRASVRLFLQADPDTQRRALSEAANDPQTIRLALRLIEGHGTACHCRTVQCAHADAHAHRDAR